MLEQLAKQLKNSSPEPQPIYSRLALSLVIFSIFTANFIYHQVANQVEVLTYRDSVAYFDE